MNKYFFVFVFMCSVVFIACGGSNDCSDVDSAVGIWQQQADGQWIVQVTKEQGTGCGKVKVTNHQPDNTTDIMTVDAQDGLPAFTVAPGDPQFSIGVDISDGHMNLVTIYTESREEVSRVFYDRIVE